jgi:hypothetical protein
MAADQSRQAIQANPGTTSKPKNKPMGSTNTATINKYDSDNRGFWAIKVGEVHACHAKLGHLMDDSDSDDDDDKWEAFRTDTWGMEDAGNLDWAGQDDQLAKEGEKLDAKPVPHNAPYVLAITNTLEPHWALDEEGYMPHIGDGHLWTTSPYGEQVADTMHHMHHPHDIVHSLESIYLNDPKPATHTCEGQSPGFDAIMQAH